MAAGRQQSRLERSYLVAGLCVLLGATLLAMLTLETEYEDTLSRYYRGMPLRIGYAVEAPFVILGQDGIVTGEAPTVLRQALHVLGPGRIDWIHVPFGNLIHELHSERIDIIAAGMFITPERAQQVRFTRPTALIQPGLLVKAGNPLDLHTIHDLVHEPSARLAVLSGSVEQRAAECAGLPQPRLPGFPDPTSAVAAVQAGRADAFALSTVSLRQLLVEHGDDQLELVPGSASDACDAIRLGHPAFALRLQDRRLHILLDQALADFLGSPEHLALVQPFGFDADALQPHPAGAPP